VLAALLLVPVSALATLLYLRKAPAQPRRSRLPVHLMQTRDTMPIAIAYDTHPDYAQIWELKEEDASAEVTRVRRLFPEGDFLAEAIYLWFHDESNLADVEEVGGIHFSLRLAKFLRERGHVRQ
jgi:hypothetical protein